MRTFLTIARFELGSRLGRPSAWVYFLVLATLGALAAALAGGAFPGGSIHFITGGKLYANSPFALSFLILLVAHFGQMMIAAIAGQATFQDVDHRCSPLFFTAPISKLQYLGGRFVGALGSSAVLFLAVGFGLWVGLHLPWIDPSKLGPWVSGVFARPYLTVLLPNLFVSCTLFFCIAALTRKMFPVYVSGVVLLLGYLVGVGLADPVEHRTLQALLDPFGTLAADGVTEYWTLAERNTRLIPLTGAFLWNRCLWVGVACALLGVTYWRFSFAHRSESGRATKAPVPEVEAPRPVGRAAPVPLDFSSARSWTLLRTLTRLQLAETVKNVFFGVIVLAGVLFVASTAPAVGKMFGTRTFPVTYQVLEVVGGTFSLFILAIITFYAGELVWRERDAGLAQIDDALPVPTWVKAASKLLALMGVQILLMAVVLVCGVCTQLFKGYFHFELPLYVEVLFGLRLLDAWCLCALALCVHTVVNHKYVAHFLMILYFLAGIALPLMGFEHNLYRFNATPQWQYSAMNGFGHQLQAVLWFRAYWALAAIALALVARLFWVRGMEQGFGLRLKQLRARLTPALAAGLGTVVTLFLALGGYIFFNTNRLNHYQTQEEAEATQADYEKGYAAWHTQPLPRVLGVKTDVDIFPSERRVQLRGTMELQNKTQTPISRVLVTTRARPTTRTLSFGRGERTVVEDPRLGVSVHELAQPLAPGEKATLRFTLDYANPGFENGGSNTDLVYNGTFFNSGYFPTVGYRWHQELSEDGKRKKHALALKPRMPDLDDAAELRNNYFIPDADFVTFEATVSTEPDQTALAPGYLIREWTEGGRRYFHYKMDAPILNFYAFISARFAVKKDHWNDVAIEVYHHPTHTYAVDRMIRSVKASLDYFTQNFGPYQHRQVRIIEFPRYATFAQSFPNTIPFSESLGFIADVDDSKEDEVDYPFYVTAHEVAHQWFAHQVVGGRVQGATVTSETLSQYAALMVMKKTFGPESMKKYLRYELDRYLRGRSMEKNREVPLLRVEDQGYIHYQKGSLVMYALQDAIGEAAVNRALKKYVGAVALKGPPFTTSRELLGYLRAETPAELQPFLSDLFETITLYELRATAATAQKQADGKYEVHVKASIKKLRAGELGEEKEIPPADWVDVGVLDAKGKVLALRRERVDKAEHEWTVVVDREPAKAGVDPLNKLIDRSPDDNVVAVELVQEKTARR